MTDTAMLPATQRHLQLLSELASDATVGQLSNRHLQILAVLAGKPPEHAATVGAVAATLGLLSSAVTRASDKLVALELVTRLAGEDDRRLVVLQLTPAGLLLDRKVAGLFDRAAA